MARSGVTKALALLPSSALIRIFPKPPPLWLGSPPVELAVVPQGAPMGLAVAAATPARSARRRLATSGTSMSIAGCREGGDFVPHYTVKLPRLQKNRSPRI